jgi:hypothetical protein
MSISSESSATSGTCSNSSHWSTPAPITPGYFPDINENPLPAHSNTNQKQAPNAKCAATPTRVSVHAERMARLHAEATASSSSSGDAHDKSSPSIHQYSSALRLTMRKRYEEARRKMSQDEGKVVMDFSWDDEDPIDRHVELIKAKAEWQEKRDAEKIGSSSSNTRPNIRPTSSEVSPKTVTNIMLGRPELATTSHDDGLPPPRPTLLDFRSLSHLHSSYYGSDGGDTPGSVCSTGSFEAGSSEDWLDMYGRTKSGDVLRTHSLPLDSPTIINRMSQATITSDASSDTITSSNTVIVNRSSTAPSSAMPHIHVYAQPCPNPTESGSLFQPLPTPAPSSSMANGYFAIPTKSAPAPTSRAYPMRPTIGVRQKSRSHPYATTANRQRGISTDLLRVDLTPDEPDYSGRTDSEQMILRAGLRSQRTRTVNRA